MAKTETITLAGVGYTVHAFNISELEEITEIMEIDTSNKIAFKILRIALRRAEPKIEDVNAVEASSQEIRVALEKLLELAGLKVAGENPPGAVA